MDRTGSLTPARSQWPPLLLLAGLPSAMVLWDGLTGAGSEDALWMTPAPVLAALIGLVLYALAARAPWPLAMVGLAPRLAVLLGLWAVAMATVQATQPVYALIKLGDLALAAALALALAGMIRRRGGDVSDQLILALVLGVAASLPLVALARALNWPEGLGKLALPGYTHIRILGFALALAFVAGASQWGRAPGPWRAGLFASLVLLATALVWSGGRGAMLALCVLPPLALILPSLRPGLLPGLAALLVGAALSQALPQEAAELGLAGRLSDGGGDIGSGRLEMWVTLWAALSDAPLLGHGYAQTHWIFKDAGHGVAHLHAHNIVLDAALGLGIPGAAAALLLALWVWSLWLARARRSGDGGQATGVAMVAAFGVLSLVDGAYFYYQGLVPLALGCSLAVGRADQDRSRRTS